MNIRIFRYVCAFLAVLGYAIIGGTIAAYFMGAMDKLLGASIVLKVSTSLLRAIFLIMCDYFSSARPKIAAMLAWLALVTYVVGASADMIYKYGLVGAAENIMPAFYLMSAVHIVAALVLQVLVVRIENSPTNG